MKKIIVSMLCLLLSIGSTIAQAKPAPQAADKAKAATAKAKGPTKADGTLDMRYKANKDAKSEVKPAGPTKADGTPDMRYKANKPNEKATKTAVKKAA